MSQPGVRFSRNLLSYSGASLVAQGFQLVQGFLLRHLLAPSLMGIWNYVGVAQSTVTTFDAGVALAAARELPLLRGAGRIDEERLVRATAYWAQAAQSLAFALGLLIYSRFVSADGMPLSALGIAAALVIASTSTETINVLCQSAQQYRPLATITVLSSGLSMIGLPLSAWLFGLTGLLGGSLAVAAVQATIGILLARSAGVAIEWRGSVDVLKRLVAFGVPLRFFDYPMSLVSIADLLFVAKYFDTENLAIYTTARLFFTMATDVPGRMGNVLLSRMYTQTGAGKLRAEIGSEVDRFFAAQHLVIMPFLISSVAVGANLAVKLLIPKYQNAVPIGEWLLLAVYFVPASTLIRNFWIVEKRLGALFWSNVAGLAAMAAALYVLPAIFGWSLSAVAVGVVSGYLVHFVTLLVTLGPSLWARRAWPVGLRALAACAYTGVAVQLVRFGTTGSMEAVLSGSALRWILIQVLLLPLYSAGYKTARLGEFVPSWVRGHD